MHEFRLRNNDHTTPNVKQTAIPELIIYCGMLPINTVSVRIPFQSSLPVKHIIRQLAVNVKQYCLSCSDFLKQWCLT